MAAPVGGLERFHHRHEAFGLVIPGDIKLFGRARDVNVLLRIHGDGLAARGPELDSALVGIITEIILYLDIVDAALIGDAAKIGRENDLPG